MSRSEQPRILVVGAGALGGVVTHELMSLGHDVTLLTHDPDVARVLRVSGLRDVRSGELQLPRVILGHPDPGQKFDFFLLATQPQQVEMTVEALAGFLGERGRFVCMQNGLCEERAAKHVPRSRVIGAVAAFGASTHGPGLCERTSSGGIALGNLDGAYDETLEILGGIMGGLGPVRLTTNLQGIRWSKLAINCATSTLSTIGGERLGKLLGHTRIRKLALAVMSECVAVASASHVVLERLPGIPPLEWLIDAGGKRRVMRGREVMSHAVVLAIGARYRRLRSSMLRAIERGRAPAVDYLNGEVVERGAVLGIATPANLLALRMVWSIARGERRSSVETLLGLCDAAERAQRGIG